MPSQNLRESRLKVAIIGAGPAGLGAAIEFNKLPFVDWTVYEKASAVREIGAGLSIQSNTWRLLESMGAAKNLKPKDFFRPADNHSVQHRNGRTGELLVSHGQPGTPESQLHARAHRAKLQNALLKEVDTKHISLSKRLIKVTRQASGRQLIEFQDGFKDEVDLVVGADGVRSVVRSFAFPDHRVSYTGRTSYRTLITSEEVARVPDVPNAVTFWQGPSQWLYTCPLGDGLFEITTMVNEPNEGGEKEKVSWGQDATVEQMTRHFKDFAPITKDILALSKDVKQYALFAGPRLESVVATGSVALVGDASHPLSGAFGNGAGFALEDVYALAASISWAYERDLNLSEGLNLFDQVRSPHYAKLYGILDEFGKTDAYVRASNFDFDGAVKVLIEQTWSQRHHWLYDYDVRQGIADAIKAADAQSPPSRLSSRL